MANWDELYDCEDDGGAQDRRREAEYQRGYAETAAAQQAGPPGSAAREAAYAELEARWEREGLD
jgi:hypothetical protein